MKKWDWSGELFMETAPKKSAPATRVCNITMLDATTPRPNGLRLSICLSTETSVLRLEKLHDAADIYTLLRACAPIQQFCKVTHKSAADESALKTLSGYMARRRQVRPTVSRRIMY